MLVLVVVCVYSSPAVLARPRCWHQVERDGKIVEDQDERNRPLASGSCICGGLTRITEYSGSKDDGQSDSYDDNDDFEDVRDPKVPCKFVVSAEPEKFRGMENAGEHHTHEEAKETAVVNVGIPLGIEDGQENEECRSAASPDDGQVTKHLFTFAQVWSKAANMS